ncbi:hypothetical protein [Sulfurirhabdus autotrophica]|uniref:Core-binding (CB) domain-containing protein n=1 Tax=Sulfurirhabdus autotrophica TaxID=1706046 RepID=A0A4R3XV54_9PROT|nr:hypothetical protein [Sulfurirhabdus autotrophica]TCV81264.1 hypothetical protein EDC63_12412 [Sulfurirhabdus autotrophica]
MYIIQRKQIFWFSRKLKDFTGRFIQLVSGPQLVGKNGYIRFSLGTGNRREAEQLARRFAVEVDDVLNRHESLKQSSGQTISSDDINLAAATMQTYLLAADETVYKSALEAVLSGAEVERTPDREASFIHELPPPGVMGDAELLLQLRSLIPFFMLQATGKLPSGPVDARYIPFVTAFRQITETLDKRAEGKFIPTPPAPKPITSGNGSSCTWDYLLEYYHNHHKDLSPSSVSLYNRNIRDLAFYAKCPPAEITRSQIIGWRDELVNTVAKKTALTRLSAARTVYHYALNNELLGERRNPFVDVSVAGAKTAKSSRREFSLEALQKIFRNPPSIDDIPASAGKHAALWIPLLALYTGARREELTGLLIEEVGEVEGILYLHFKDNTLRKLKKDTCERMTPMHIEIIRLGFSEYVATVRDSGADRLFPGVVNSDGLTDWFVPFVKDRIGEYDFKQDVHSFRHTLKTAARNIPLPTEIHDAITGHKTPGVGSSYGSIAGVKTLKREIDKVVYADVVLTPPAMPTVDDIKALMADAERRRIAGRNRKRINDSKKQAEK